MLVVAISDNNVSYGNLHIPNNVIWNYFVSLMNTKTHKLFSHKMLKLLCLFLVPLCLFIRSEQIQRRQLIVIHGIITVVSFLTTRRGRMDWAAVVPFSCTQNMAEVVFFSTTIVRSYRWRPSSGRYFCFFCDGRDVWPCFSFVFDGLFEAFLVHWSDLELFLQVKGFPTTVGPSITINRYIKIGRKKAQIQQKQAPWSLFEMKQKKIFF